MNLVVTKFFLRMHKFMSLNTSFVFMQLAFSFSQTTEPHILSV